MQDRSGYICSRELGHLMRALGRNPTAAEVSFVTLTGHGSQSLLQLNEMIAEVDVDHNGSLDIKEFIKVVLQCTRCQFNVSNICADDVQHSLP